MAGLLNATAQPQGQQQNPAGAQTLDDPTLKKIEQGVEQSVPEEIKDQYLSTVIAGMNVMFSKETSNLMDEQLAASDDVVANVAEGISKLMVIIFNESKQSIEQYLPAAGPAAISLMCQALEYWEAVKGGQVTDEIAAKATEATMMAFLEKFNMSRDKVGQVIAAGQKQGGAQQPQTAGV